MERPLVHRRRHRRLAGADVRRRRGAARPPGEPPGRARGRRRRRDPLRRRRAPSASPRRTPRSRASSSAREKPVLARRQQGRRRTPRGRRRGRSPASVSATRTRCRRSTGGGAATSSTRSSTRCRPEPEPDEPDGPTTIFSVAIVGRPNVGKSTLFNRLVGDDRSIVHDLPGTTRDAIDTIVETEDGPLRFVDTAGMRRRSRIDEPTEYFSLVRALAGRRPRRRRAARDRRATRASAHQDQRLAERIDAAGTAIVIVLNKWDLLDAEGRATAKIDVADRLAFLVVRAGAHRLGAHRADDAAGPPGAAPGRGGVPPADPDRGAQPGDPRGPGQPPGAARPSATGPASSTRPRAPTTRPRSPCSRPTSSRPRTSATSSARSARRSTSARRRSSSGSAAATADSARSCRLAISWLKSSRPVTADISRQAWESDWVDARGRDAMGSTAGEQASTANVARSWSRPRSSSPSSSSSRSG